MGARSGPAKGLYRGNMGALGMARAHLAYHFNQNMKSYFTYILASRSRALYIGVTNDIERRVREHKEKSKEGFTARYNISRLVYLEIYNDVRDAIAREKQLKGWRRERKIALIESVNPTWRDLSDDRLGPDPSP